MSDRPLFEVSAPVGAGLERLREIIDDDWFLEELGWTPAMFAGGSLEREPGMITGQGGWWYRGEYVAAMVDGQVCLVHRVYNIARQKRWAVGLANRMFVGYRPKLQQRVDELARAIDARP